MRASSPACTRASTSSVTLPSSTWKSPALRCASLTRTMGFHFTTRPASDAAPRAMSSVSASRSASVSADSCRARAKKSSNSAAAACISRSCTTALAASARCTSTSARALQLSADDDAPCCSARKAAMLKACAAARCCPEAESASACRACALGQLAQLEMAAAAAATARSAWSSLRCSIEMLAFSFASSPPSAFCAAPPSSGLCIWMGDACSCASHAV
mmetsp:Transcript_19645/g.65008  ORF Transcript_19645/g.65008 Transcript_19645/m.65008 type:complete len:217 (+) Transcript_19645:248-898(+)